MAISIRSFLYFSCALALSNVSYAQLPSGNVPFAIECDGGLVDFRNQKFSCRDVVITQGEVVLKAANASSTSLDFENSVWTFSSNVVITGNNTEVVAEEAVVSFTDKQLENVKLVGEPATFQQVLRDTEELAQGRANTINYDLGKNVVTLTQNAFLSQGDDQISGDLITYDVGQERVLATSDDDGDNRVRLVITPAQNESEDDETEPEQP